MKPSEVVPTDVLLAVLDGLPYGNIPPRELIQIGLLKVACGYANGKTTVHVLEQLGLIEGYDLTARGTEYLYWSVKEQTDILRKINGALNQ